MSILQPVWDRQGYQPGHKQPDENEASRSDKAHGVTARRLRQRPEQRTQYSQYRQGDVTGDGWFRDQPAGGVHDALAQTRSASPLTAENLLDRLAEAGRKAEPTSDRQSVAHQTKKQVEGQLPIPWPAQEQEDEGS